MRLRWMTLAAAVFLAATGWAGYRLWPRKLHFRPVAMTPVWTRAGNTDIVALPSQFLVAEIAKYDDEFFAYLMFTYFQGVPEFKGSEVLLTYAKAGGGISYPIRVRLPNNLLSSLPLLAAAGARDLIGEQSWRYITGPALDKLRYQTKLFNAAYDLPARRKLESLKHAQLIGYIRRFVRFKSLTDARVRLGIEGSPHPLTSKEALQLAEDIVAVANFYSLPLDFFLGIGAMENNYMDVPGDLQHAVWKRRALKGDVVLKRRRHRALVVDSSLGVWQITRETLRYAHKLYLKDDRDYSRLPARLRPPRELDLRQVEPEVLTTYAGLLFRDLLDRCHGDATVAIGAYNGGLRNPNLNYAQGVQKIAEYARRMMEHAAVLNGPAADMSFLAARP
jgi:hypothetical protein